MGCESRRRLVRIVPPIYGTWHCYTHTNCLCNDTVACVNRVLGVVPLPTVKGVRAVRAAILRLWPPIACSPLTLEEALKTFTRIPKVYQRAYDSLLVEPLSRKDAGIKAFVKAERFDPEGTENPDPRLIQARDPRYNLNLAKYLRGLEERIYGLQKHGLPVVAKCRNPFQRASIILRKWNMLADPVFVSLDSSRWDKHISIEMLKVEHDFYMAHYCGDPDLALLLKWQLVNKCRTSNGLRYTVHGGRMSGDMNTACGNVVLACGMVFAAMEELRIRKFEVFDDGDDIGLMIERSDLARVKARLPGIFKNYGQELKIENVAHDIHDIVFCQAKPTWNGEEYTMARNWKKVLSQSCCGTKHWNDHRLVRPMFGLLGDCEMAQHHGIPILQAFAARLRELSGGERSLLSHLDSSYQYRIGNYKLENLFSAAETTITHRSRLEFQLSWGVTPSEQLAIEDHIAQWTPGTEFRDVGVEIHFPWVQYLDPGINNPTCL
jgi:hypothetical protein